MNRLNLNLAGWYCLAPIITILLICFHAFIKGRQDEAVNLLRLHPELAPKRVPRYGRELPLLHPVLGALPIYLLKDRFEGPVLQPCLSALPIYAPAPAI